MKPAEIEKWALDIIDRVVGGRPVEDARVELKAVWLADPAKAARRLAGHANAIRGERILWLIGVNEKANAIPGVSQQDLAQWWPQVQACFDGAPPRLAHDIVVTHGSASVVALHFETDRAPFVVKNPAGGEIGFEVPWREATGIRSARREDLRRILVPATLVPDCDVFSISMTPVQRSAVAGQTLPVGCLELDLFIRHYTEAALFVAFHRCEMKFRIGDRGWVPLDRVVLSGAGPASGDHVLRTISWNDHQARIQGPTRACLRGDFGQGELQAVRACITQPIEVNALVPIVGADRPMAIEVRMPMAIGDAHGQFNQWSSPGRIGRWAPQG